MEIQSLKGIEHFTALTSLKCSFNLLKTLDLTQNTALEDLNISRNQIKGETMDALVASLPAVSKGKLYAIYNKQEQNEITTTQVTAANANGWTIRT